MVKNREREVQIRAILPEKVYKDLKELSILTGIRLNKLVALKVSGYEVVKTEETGN